MDKAFELIEKWKNSLDFIEELKSQINKTESNMNNAKNELGKLLVPEDANIGEVFSIWYNDELFQITKVSHSDYQLSIRPKGKERKTIKETLQEMPFDYDPPIEKEVFPEENTAPFKQDYIPILKNHTQEYVIGKTHQQGTNLILEFTREYKVTLDQLDDSFGNHHLVVIKTYEQDDVTYILKARITNFSITQ